MLIGGRCRTIVVGFKITKLKNLTSVTHSTELHPVAHCLICIKLRHICIHPLSLNTPPWYTRKSSFKALQSGFHQTANGCLSGQFVPANEAILPIKVTLRKKSCFRLSEVTEHVYNIVTKKYD